MFRSRNKSSYIRPVRQLALAAVSLLLGNALVATQVLAQPANGVESDRWLITGRTMGPVPYSVVIASPPPVADRSRTETAIEQTLDRINQLMSTYLDDSDISRFNRSESTDWFPVELETAHVVQRAIEIHDTIEKAFDIRVATAVERWNFGPNRKAFELPSESEIADLNRLLKNGQLSARLESPSIKKSDPELKIDLSAIAKGYAVDQVIKILSELGYEHVMVEVGGEVYAMGYRDAKQQPWRIGIERPSKGARAIQAKIPLHNQALATSGNYRNFFMHAGKYYSHTIDPDTSRPVDHFLASATVIAEDCMTADALATAVMVVGAGNGHLLAEQNQFLLLTIDRDGGFDGDLVVRSTEDFPLADDSPSAGVLKDQTTKSDSASIWPTFLAALLIFSIAIIGMAVGSIFANKPVTGSCGGMSAMAASGNEGDDETGTCGVCSKPVTDCVERETTESA